MSQTAVVKGAVHAYKRRRLEGLAAKLEEAVSRNRVRATDAMVNRLAPVPTRVTVCQKTELPTWVHAGEIEARKDALVTIFGAEPLSLDLVPQLPQAKP